MLHVEIDKNLAKFENLIYFDLIYPPVVEINKNICTSFESLSKLQLEKVQYRYKGQLQESSRLRGSRQT
jgi:hypothetical protein